MAGTWGQYYHEIASTMGLYCCTNAQLARQAGLCAGMTVVDLGAGSGLTAMAALDQVPQGLRLSLVDLSPSMIAEARKHLGERVEAYHVCDAASLSTVIPGKVDRVLCNLSFWYFRQPEAVLAEVKKILKPTGRLCFTLLGTHFNTGGSVVSPAWALQKVMHDRGMLPKAPLEVERMPNQRSIEGTLNGAGFKPFHYEMIDIATASPETQPGGELHSWVRLFPVTDGADPYAAAAKSVSLLPDLAGDIAAWQPRWRAALFMAGPNVDPVEALMSRLGGQPKS